jgi:hypothetical protein
MRGLQLSIIIFLLTMGCTNQKTTPEQTTTDTVTQSSARMETLPANNQQTQITLTDTVLNGHSTKFYELTEATFDSLQRHAKQTEINLKSADNEIKTLDSCVVIKSKNQKTDTLCNWDDGEQFEKYLIRGLWEDKELLLVNFENWEENHDFFISLKDGSYYILTPFYEVNPKKDIVLTYVDIAAAPIYPSELMVSKVQKGAFTTLYKKDLGETTIIDAKWISNSDCLLTTGFVGIGTNDVKDKKWYRMTLE